MNFRSVRFVTTFWFRFIVSFILFEERQVKRWAEATISNFLIITVNNTNKQTVKRNSNNSRRSAKRRSIYTLDCVVHNSLLNTTSLSYSPSSIFRTLALCVQCSASIIERVAVYVARHCLLTPELLTPDPELLTVESLTPELLTVEFLVGNKRGARIERRPIAITRSITKRAVFEPMRSSLMNNSFLASLFKTNALPWNASRCSELQRGAASCSCLE